MTVSGSTNRFLVSNTTSAFIKLLLDVFHNFGAELRFSLECSVNVKP